MKDTNISGTPQDVAVEFMEWLDSLSPGNLLVGAQVTGFWADLWPTTLKSDLTHINAGAFQRIDGRVRETSEYCTGTNFLILDDIGTEKGPVPPTLPPSWIIETSPGNQQWGYILDDVITEQQGADLTRGVAAAGLADCESRRESGQRNWSDILTVAE